MYIFQYPYIVYLFTLYCGEGARRCACACHRRRRFPVPFPCIESLYRGFYRSRKVNVCSAVEGTPKGVQKCYASISQSGLRFLYANYGSGSRPQKTDVSQIVAKHSRQNESAYRGNSPFQGTINSLDSFLPLNWCYAYA